MLEAPKTEPSGAVEKPPPCFRCLFEKPVSDAWCDPASCEMLEHWLSDDNFEWKTYAFGWELNLELKFAKINGSSETV